MLSSGSSVERTSDILEQLAVSSTGETITVSEIVGVLRDRAFALMLVLLGLPNCLPMPPPIALVSGFLIAFVALQMILGFPVPWLPKRILALSMGRATLERTLTRASPYIRFLERLAKPRLTLLDSPLAVRALGILLLIIAIAMIVAVPVIGQIPLGIAVCLIGLGLVERDGLLVIAGLISGMIGVAIAGSVILGIVLGILQGVA